jgi:glutamyl-tRNA synthetase
MIRHFTLDRVNKSPASFDPKKLVAFQADAFARLPLETRISRVEPFARRAGLLATRDSERLLRAVVEAAQDRLTMAGDIIDFDYFFVDDYPVDDAAFQKRIRDAKEAPELLRGLRNCLAEVNPFDAATIESGVNGFCEARGIKLRDLIHAIRIATTGKSTGFGMFDTLAILGRDRVLHRMEAAAEQGTS